MWQGVATKDIEEREVREGCQRERTEEMMTQDKRKMNETFSWEGGGTYGGATSVTTQ